MDKKIILFDVLNDTMSIISEKQPGNLIPFKGDFPLLEPWQENLFRKGTSGEDKMYLQYCEPWIQDILIKDQSIRDIVDDFREYITTNGILETYFKMSVKKKADEISRFLSISSLDVSCLTIKKNGEF